EFEGDDQSILKPVSQPTLHPWFALLLVAIGLCLVLPWGLKVWSYGLAVRGVERMGYAASARDALGLIVLSPDLALDLALYASTVGATADSARSSLDPEQQPAAHVVVRTTPLPNRNDAALGAVGLVVALIGAGRIISW